MYVRAVFFPAAFACVRALYGSHPSPQRAFALAATLLNPAAIIIDHGHFQVCVIAALIMQPHCQDIPVASIIDHGLSGVCA